MSMDNKARALLIGYEFDDECADAHKLAEVATLMGLRVIRDGHGLLLRIEEDRQQ
jgi:hypothetical protein